MQLTENQINARLQLDQIYNCGQEARSDLRRLCQEHDILDTLNYTNLIYLKVIKIVWNLWHRTDKFKVGDKVHVVPLTPTFSKYCIRAVVTEANDDGFGYRLRAFKKDLPGIYMFNIWDKDLQPRSGNVRIPTPNDLLLED